MCVGGVINVVVTDVVIICVGIDVGDVDVSVVSDVDDYVVVIYVVCIVSDVVYDVVIFICSDDVVHDINVIIIIVVCFDIVCCH